MRKSEMKHELESFRLTPRLKETGGSSSIAPKRREVQPFVKGPISLKWIQRASNIPRRSAIVVGIVLWYLAGFKKSASELVLCASRCEPFGLKRKAVNRGLRDLESAGLVQVERSRGKCPRVDILPVQSAED